MMRILHVVASDQRRGAELFASDLIRSSAGNGISQHVAVIRQGEGNKVTYEAPTSVLSSGKHTVPGLRVDLGGVRALRTLIRAWAPSVVQAHGGEPLKYAVLIGSSAPVVYRRIGSALPRITTGIARSGHSALMRRTSRIVAVAEAVRRETIRTFRVPPGRVVTIAGGVDSKRLHPEHSRTSVRRELGIDERAPVILSLGALTWEKDPLAHIRVTTKVMRDLPEAVHVLAGDGPMRGDVEATVRSSGLHDRVLVLGNRGDVADLLAASDVMLFASRSDGMEGMPGCLIEAGMAGLPVAAYSVAGVPELVVHGTTGMVVPPGDEDGLTQSLVRLLEDAARRRDMGRAARERCRSLFDIDVVAPRYLELYREVARAS